MTLRVGALLALVGTAIAVVALVPHDPAALGRAADAAGPWAGVAFVGAWAIGSCLMLSGTVLSVVGGVLFGPLGVLLSLVGSPIGALLAFLIGRTLGRDAVLAGLPRRIAALAQRLERSGARGVAAVRLVPAVPVGAFNYACGLTRLRPREFVLGSAVGAAPRIVLYGLAGGAMAHAGLWAPIAVSAVLGLVTLAAVMVARQSMPGRLVPAGPSAPSPTGLSGSAP
jgi:uncharacterized membrane protein YdjX (TVP38/TMEM64 family)